ncbi:MAG: signal recognition particle-docking protein FtsY [Desulfatibacillaceae bacterium]
MSAETSGGGLLSQLKDRLTKTRRNLNERFDEMFTASARVDDELLEELEEALIVADVGVPTTAELIRRLNQRIIKEGIEDASVLRHALREEVRAMLEPAALHRETPPPLLQVVMIVGVNGTGKTTSVGKLAAHYRELGHNVLMVAADTFRAAAVEQLEIWAERADVKIIRQKQSADPAAVVFDGVQAAQARDTNTVLIDTAGRLHTKVNLMEELKKIRRTAARKDPAAPHETWLVLDATTGQNALSQARMFNEAIGLTGLIITKLDGTAKGGIALAVCNELKVPLRFIGIGEKLEDLREFDPDAFVEALF